MKHSEVFEEHFSSVCIISRFGYVVIPSGGQVHRPDVDNLLESMPLSAIVAARCNRCGSQYLLIDEDIQEPEIQERQMENERFYFATCYSHCTKCDVDLSVELQFSIYAYEWSMIEQNCDNCAAISVDGLDLLIDEGKRIEASPQDNEVDDWAESPTGCAVFVEGDDDQFVLIEFFRRITSVDPSSIGIHVLTGMGGGGREWVVKSAEFVDNVMRRVHRDISYVVVLDGDAAVWAKGITGPVSKHLFLLSKKEVDSYLLETSAIARAFASPPEKVAQLVEMTRGNGKEALEFVLKKLGFRPTPQVKQMVARHLESVPDDFLKLSEIVQSLL